MYRERSRGHGVRSGGEGGVRFEIIHRLNIHLKKSLPAVWLLGTAKTNTRFLTNKFMKYKQTNRKKMSKEVIKRSFAGVKL